MANLKPVYHIPVDAFKNQFSKMGLNVSAIGNPTTITGLKIKLMKEDYETPNFNFEDLQDESRLEIDTFLNLSNADCGIIMNMVARGKGYKFAYGDITILPHKLTIQNDKT